jgi:predicted phage tail protein
MSEIIKIGNPFRRSQGKHIQIAPGQTIEEICKDNIEGDIRFDCECVTAIDGRIIEIPERKTRKLKEGEYLLIVPKVAGGDDGKSIVNAISMIALFAVAGPLANQLAISFGVASATGYALFYVATVVGGGMLVNSLQPHPKKPSSGFIDDEQSQSFGWNPATVQRQGIPVARFYGLNKMFGNVIAAHTEKESDTFEMTTITEIFYYDRWGERTPNKYGAYFSTTSTSQGRTSFDPRKVNLYTLFCLGMGPMREAVVLDSIKLNEQQIANLSNVFYEERVGDLSQQRISYFDKTKLEVVPGRLVVNGTPVIYTTSNGNFNDLEIELAFPKGLYDASGGDLANYTVNVTVEIKKTTSSTWTLLADGVNITDNVGDKVIETYTTVDTFAVEFGSNYDIRVTKNTAERDDIKYGDDLFLDKVRELIDWQFTYPRRALVGIKALATDQLSGSIRFSCLSRGLYVRQYSNSLGGAIGYSNNPADVIADILTQPVYSGAHSPWLDLKLLLNFEGADAATTMVDDSPKGHEATFGGGAELDTAIKKFGSASGLLDGVDSYWSFANDGNSFGMFNNLVEDWTLDFYIAMGDHVGAEALFGQYLDADNRTYLEHLHGTGFTLSVRINTVEIISITGIGEIADNDLHHIAICKVGAEVGIYKDGTQIGYALMASAAEYVYDETDFMIGQNGNAGLYTYANYDHFRIQKYNVFSAAPVVGLTDTITQPAAAYTDPGNSYSVARYDGYNPSKLLTADFEDLADWCDDAEVNPVNNIIDTISLATEAVIVTRSQNNYKVDDKILFRNIDTNGMVEIADETTADITKVYNEYTFTINLDTSGYTALSFNLQLSILFNGLDGSTDFIDSSGYSRIITAVGTAQLDTANKKFGASSGLFDGDSDNLTLADNAAWDITTYTNYTVEFFVKHTDHIGSEIYASHFEDVDNYWALWHLHGSGLIFTLVSGSVTEINLQTAYEIEDTAWHHIALIKLANVYYIYVDGIMRNNVTDAFSDTFAGLLYIGQLGNDSGWFDGNIDRLHIYTSNIFGVAGGSSFTVPVDEDLILPTVEIFKPRFSFNGGFDTETNMWEAALKVCELCRCVPFWDGDTIRLAIDKAGSSVYAFTMGNIIKDSFKQRFIPTAERASEIEVHYRDASQDYERQPFTLVNDSIGNVSNKIRLDLFGITDTDMANRLADFKLLQNLNIKNFAIWNSEIDAIACTIGDIVDVQHDVTNWGSIGSGDDPYTGGGRVVFATNITNAVITIDGDMYFDDADWRGGSTAYKILLKTSDDATPESKTITGITESTVVGGTFDITVSGTFTANPKKDDIWAAGVATYETKEYRIVNMRQTSEQRVEITAVEYNSAIYVND